MIIRTLLVSGIVFLAGTGLADESCFRAVQCEGTYRHHLQGICTNEKDAIYWSFTTALVKTDTNGKVLNKVAVANHHGDLCHVDFFGSLSTASAKSRWIRSSYRVIQLDNVPANFRICHAAHFRLGLADIWCPHLPGI